MRTTLRGKLLAIAVAPLLLASVSAASPLARATAPAVHSPATHGQVDHRETYFADAAKTQEVGVGYIYCDGDYTLAYGYRTPYIKRLYYTPPCP